MRALALLLIAGAVPLASCASGNSAAPAPTSPAGMTGSFVLRNESKSTLTVQPFEAARETGTRQPFGPAFTIAPGSTDSRDLGAPGRVVALTVKASGQDIKYQSGEWVVTERPGGFRLYAFTDDSNTVRLYWNDRNGQEITMQ